MDAPQPVYLPTFKLAKLEEIAIREALVAADGNRTRAAELLGISIRTLQRHLHRLQLQEVQ